MRSEIRGRGGRRALGCAWVLVAALACNPGPGLVPDPAVPGGRVLLIGIDGAAPRLAFPWLEAGELPHLAQLARDGVSGPLLAHHPLISPRIWTSVATGKGPARHGIFHWLHEEEGRLRLLKSLDRQGHALWNIASEAGLNVGVVNWLNTYPPEVVSGVMVSDFAVPGQQQERARLGGIYANSISGGRQTEVAVEPIAGGTVYPEAWERRVFELAAPAAESDELDELDDPFAAQRAALRPRLRDLIDRVLRADRLVARVALAVEREEKPDVMLVYLPGIDRVSHHLWAGIDTRHPYPESLRFGAAEAAAAEAVLHRYYQLTDGFIGELLEGYGPDDLVIVASDHGFEARVLESEGVTGGHDSERAQHGVLFARGAKIPAGGAAGPVGVNDLTPTILSWLGLPLAADMDGRPAHFLKRSPPREIASYDGGVIERLEPSAAPEVEEQIIEQLRSFGYVEE